jgi:hypothetical protein
MGSGFLIAAQWTIQPELYVIGFIFVVVQTASRKQWNLVALNINGLGSKEKIILRGVITTYTRRLYPGDIYTTEKRLEKHTKESLKQLLVGFINRNLLKPFSNIFGMVGYVWHLLYLVILVLTVGCLLAVSVLT